MFKPNSTSLILAAVLTLGPAIAPLAAQAHPVVYVGPRRTIYNGPKRDVYVGPRRTIYNGPKRDVYVGPRRTIIRTN